MLEPNHKITIGSQIDFGKAPYTPARLCKRIGLVEVLGGVQGRARGEYETHPGGRHRMAVTLHWPTAEELGLIAASCRRREVWNAFGFKRPALRDPVIRWRMPDGGGAFEPVEYLVVEQPGVEQPFGFFVLYDISPARDRICEMDFAVFDPKGLQRINLISLKVIVLSYLFAIRGCARVIWKRVARRRHWTEFPNALRRHLRASEERRTALPQVVLRSTPWTQAVFGGMEVNLNHSF